MSTTIKPDQTSTNMRLVLLISYPTRANVTCVGIYILNPIFTKIYDAEWLIFHDSFFHKYKSQQKIE